MYKLLISIILCTLLIACSSTAIYSKKALPKEELSHLSTHDVSFMDSLTGTPIATIDRVYGEDGKQLIGPEYIVDDYLMKDVYLEPGIYKIQGHCSTSMGTASPVVTIEIKKSVNYHFKCLATYKLFGSKARFIIEPIENKT